MVYWAGSAILLQYEYGIAGRYINYREFYYLRLLITKIAFAYTFLQFRYSFEHWFDKNIEVLYPRRV